MKKIVIILGTIILLGSCNATKKIDQQKETKVESCESMTYNSSLVNKISTDYYSIDTLFIKNNCLQIWVSYSGGCGDVEFRLYYSDRVKESMPPKTNLRLQLYDDDPCRAIVQQKLYYNLSFFDDYALRNGIQFVLVGSDKKVLYKK